MKRNILLGLVMALILAVSASGFLFGEQDKKKPPMILICHVINEDGTGVAITVPNGGRAEKVHLAHDDCRLSAYVGKVGDPCKCKVGGDKPR